MTSHGNELYLTFKTDLSYAGKGFSASYTSRASCKLKIVISEYSKNNFFISSPACGGIYKVRQGTFTSPRYPSNYAPDLYCEWFLEVEDNHRVSLSFDDFSTESACEHDSVKVITTISHSIATL